MKLWWGRLVSRPAAMTQSVIVAPDLNIPSRGRQKSIRSELKRNEALRKPPCDGVRLKTLGELLWILREKQWRGGMKDAPPLLMPKWIAELNDKGYSEPAILRGADLHGVILNFANLQDIDLREANLSESQFVGADLSGALLTKAISDNAVFLSGSEIDALREKRQRNDTIDRPPYYRVALTSRNQLEWIFREHSWSGLPTTPTGSERADFSGADLRYLDLSGVDFVGAKLSGTLLIEPQEERTLRKRYTLNTHIGNAPYEGVELKRHQHILWIMRERGWKAEDAVEAKARVNLIHADLTDARLGGMGLRYASLIGASLTGANLRKCDLTLTVLRDADFSGAMLCDATLLAANAERAHFDGANAQRVDFRNSKLREAILSSANLDDALVIDADLREVELRRTNLSGANLTSVRLDAETTFEGASVDEDTVFGENNWSSVSLSSILWQDIRKVGDEIIPEIPASYSRSMAARLRDNTRRLAVRTYRGLWFALRAQGVESVARRFHLRYERLRRGLLRKEGNAVFRNVRFLFSLGLDAIVGYGEAPVRTFLIYLASVSFFSTVYWGLVDPASHISLRWLDWLLFSFVTFHGRGLFDNIASLSQAHGLLPLMALLESALGIAIEFIFVAAFTRRFLGE